jgi:3'(2'), 5'-bisphosphate nucleotidase
MNPDLHALLEPARRIAIEAGERIMRIYDRGFDVQHKEDRSPLTEADLAAHRHIVAELGALSPGIPILSEESASEVPAQTRLGWRTFWLVDPLDGTKEFIKRNGEFTVNIALVQSQRPVLGVVHVPAKGVTYWGTEEGGAFREDASGEVSRIGVQRVGERPRRVVGSRSHAGPHLEAYVNALGEHELVSQGSSLKLCLVADGSADVYPRFGPTSDWDTAAAQAVVTSAGGRVVDLHQRPLLCNRGESILNPYFIVYGDDSVDWFAPIPKQLRQSETA